MNSDLVLVEQLFRRVLFETLADFVCAAVALYALVEVARCGYWQWRDSRGYELEHPDEFTEP